jgi:hypothetical protein
MAMSKKPNRSRHRIPLCAYAVRSDSVEDRYQAEVDSSTARLERRYRKAAKALEAAEHRADRARVLAAANIKDRKARRRHVQLVELVEERRRELRQIELLMMPTPYNGRDSRRRGARHETGGGGIALGGYRETEIR